MYSAWIAFGGASLLIALSACQPEIASVQNNADAVSTEVGMARELHDAARHRVWRLTQGGLALENDETGKTQFACRMWRSARPAKS